MNSSNSAQTIVSTTYTYFGQLLTDGFPFLYLFLGLFVGLFFFRFFGKQFQRAFKNILKK